MNGAFAHIQSTLCVLRVGVFSWVGFSFDSGFSRMKHLERRYGTGQLHFITCSCYRRMPSLGTARERYDFALLGYVVMPEHIHLLISEPRIGTPSTVMQVLKQCVSRTMRRKRR